MGHQDPHGGRGCHQSAKNQDKNMAHQGNNLACKLELHTGLRTPLRRLHRSRPPSSLQLVWPLYLSISLLMYFDNSSRFRSEAPSSPGPKTSFTIKPSFPCKSPKAIMAESTVDVEDQRRRRLASRARAASKSPTIGLYETHFSDSFNATAILRTAIDNRSEVDSNATIPPGPSHYDVSTIKTLAAEVGTKGSSFVPHSPTKCLKVRETGHLGPGSYDPQDISLAKKSHNKSPPSKATLYLYSPKHSPRQGAADKVQTISSNSSNNRSRTPSQRSANSDSTIRSGTKAKSRRELKEAFLLVKDMRKLYPTNVESSEEYMYRELHDGAAEVHDGFLSLDSR